MGEDYNDGRVECTKDGVHLHWYYFPVGSKRIPYGNIREVQRVDIGAFRGRARIWGTANFHYWANLDPARPKKKVGLVLDLGKSVKPFITPDNPELVEALIRERANLGPASDTSERAPLI
jgi:hypothetical protein